MTTRFRSVFFWILVLTLVVGFVGYQNIDQWQIGLRDHFKQQDDKRSVIRLMSQMSNSSNSREQAPNLRNDPDVCMDCTDSTDVILQKSKVNILLNETTPRRRQMATTKSIQKERLKLLEEGCRHYRNHGNQIYTDLEEFVATRSNMNSFISVPKYNFIYNFVHKVGSSQIQHMIKKTTGSAGKRMYQMSGDKAKKLFLDNTVFIFVRHPLTRLLSAYRDKFVFHHIDHYIRIGRDILKATRPNVTNDELRKADDVTFLEFIKFITGTPKSRRGNTHWVSLLMRNKICDVKHHFIGKLETMNDDMNYLMTEILHVQGWKSGNSNHIKNASNSTQVLKSYYSKIPEELMKKLYFYYEADFKLFGYDMQVPL